MNLKQLEAFACVAELKSFSGAAKKLYLTQPTISAHIHSLEKELGCVLFIRTTKDVVLSEDGELLYRDARQIMQLEKKILNEFCHRDDPDSRRVRVGASTVPGQYILPEVLSEFSRRFPEYQMEIEDNDSLGVIRMVLDGDVEVGFTGTKQEEPSCVFDSFYEDRLVLITPNTEAYQAFSGGVFPLEQIYRERLIVREQGSGTRKETEKYLKDAGIDLDRLHFVATMSNQETIKKSVRSGMGISFISSAAVEESVRQGTLLQFDLADQGQCCRRLYMVWSKNHKPDHASRTFIQFVREMYQS